VGSQDILWENKANIFVPRAQGCIWVCDKRKFSQLKFRNISSGLKKGGRRRESKKKDNLMLTSQCVMNMKKSTRFLGCEGQCKLNLNTSGTMNFQLPGTHSHSYQFFCSQIYTVEPPIKIFLKLKLKIHLK